MRTFRIEIDGRAYIVAVDQIGKDRFRTQVNHESFEIDGTNDENAAWLVRCANEALHAHTKTLPNGRVDVWLAGIPFPASVQALGSGGYAISAERQGQRSIGGEVRALMPGRITSILIKEGESVKEGTPLLILEAMKMQNEITSPITGRVKSVLVQEGVTVKKDSVLIELE